MATPTGGAGTGDTRVDRPEEGLPGLATVQRLGYPNNPTANPPTRATFDAGFAGVPNTRERERPTAQIDTTQTDGLPMDQSIKRGQPSAW